jgi:hypothetical protein
LKWNWDSPGWKKSNKLLLLLATIWPVIYMVLFFAIVFSMISLTSPAGSPGHRNCGYLDALQLDQKIKDGEIKQLTVQRNTFVATSRLDDCEYEVFITNESSHEQILKDARESVNNQPRVDRIFENTSRPEIPPAFAPLGFLGFLVLVVLHLGTMLLMTAQMPFYIVLAVKNDRLDQTKKIIWVVLFAVLALFAAPVYWYLHIWRAPKTNGDSESLPPGLNSPTAI